MSRACYVNSLSVRESISLVNVIMLECAVDYCIDYVYLYREKKGRRMIDKRRKYVCNIILLIVSTDNEEKLMVRIMS